MRRRFKGNRPMVNIGYGSDKRTKYLRPDHFKTFLVQNVKDLDLLLMHNRTYAAEIGRSVSYRTRKDIVQRAAQLDIKVTNGTARMKSTD
jgi:large subunit ribosomal protein L32e